MRAATESVFTMKGHFEPRGVSNIQPVMSSKMADVITLSAYIPKWLPETTKALYAILSLGDNWDTYGAKRINFETAAAVDELLREIMRPNTPAPQLVPVANGYIQIEWHLGDIDFEIEVESLSESQVFFADARHENAAWEGKINYDLSKLVSFVNLLTDRACNNNK